MNNLVHYYVDESGDLELKGSNYFLLGCVIINNPDINVEKIKQLETDIMDNIALHGHKMDNGFHACENHPEIYQKYIELLFLLDFRAYIVVLNKSSKYFEKLIKNCTKQEIYNQLIYKLLYGRLLKRNKARNIITFERQGHKLEKERVEKESLVASIGDKLKSKHLIESDIEFEVSIVGKDDVLISMVDYVLHIFGRVYGGSDKAFIKRHFELIEPKIGMVLDVATDKYHKLRSMVERFI